MLATGTMPGRPHFVVVVMALEDSNLSFETKKNNLGANAALSRLSPPVMLFPLAAEKASFLGGTFDILF